ncbi:xanthine dehydrogenase family protein molybdopterin-binding subunit [Luteimonas salinilitoris]|uniref:Molybdopterin cofactor-binding domain-containing protein n=1 Tax=Luteimonas salinilitoris TaxID=3237697 RepID=A0ABV4HSF8_9GAMM
MNTATDASRRRFLKTGAVLGGGLVVAIALPGARRLAMAQEAVAGVATFAPNAFLRIGSDDRITVLLAHSEMGQGVWTTLPLLIAEELDADWSTIRVEHAPAAPAYAHTAMGIQMTGGSTSTWSEFDRYRQAGALARALLVQAAAQRFGVPAERVRAENGELIAGDRRLRYGEVAAAAAELPAPASVPLKDPKQWTRIGRPTRRLDTPEKITGRAIFGIDVRFEGLLTAAVARAPVFGARLASFDDSDARAVAGVRDVVQVPSGVAVVADHFWAAKRGRDALRLQWEPGDGAAVDSDALLDDYRRLAETEGAVAASAGNAAAALESAARVVEAEYTVPYLAHAAMEPLNCTVRLDADLCEVWTGTQFQTLDMQVAQEVTGLGPERIRIHTTFLGGAFGRRATPTCDFVREALHVAKATGRPVKTVWTREDDMHGGYYRPAFLHRARVGLDAAGRPMAWRHTIVGQSILGGTPFAAMIENGIDNASVEGASDSPYLRDVPDHRVDLHSPTNPVPVLWWRSVGHTHTGFAMESLVDELAHAAGRDPVDYRRDLLKDHPRHLAALDLAVEHAGWTGALPEGRARGVAVHESFGSYVAQVAEVSMEDGRIRVHRVVCAIDCGVAVNPEGVRAQMESGIVFGLGAALYGTLTLREGRVQESNYHDYRVLRMHEMPKIEVHIVPSTGKMGGAGEPGTPPIAPAVANAVFALTGQRLRDLPLRPAAADTSAPRT